MSARLELTVDESPERYRVTVSGELDVSKLPELERKLLDDAEGTKRVEIELSRLEKLSVVGAAGIVAMIRVLQDHKVDVAMSEPTDACRSTFVELGVWDLLPFEDLEEGGAK